MQVIEEAHVVEGLTENTEASSEETKEVVEEVKTEE